MVRNDASVIAFRSVCHHALACLAAATLITLAFEFAVTPVEKAYAQDDASRPSVLVLDSGLGDYELGSLYWIGENSKVVADRNGLSLITADHPAWWTAGGGQGEEPATFMLGGTSATAPNADDIVWALDQIRASGAEPKTFVVAMGGSGFALRQYAEDLASTKQSHRGDLVGMGFCGTPHGGYSAIELYPEQKMWDKLAESAGLKREDLMPNSGFLTAIDKGAFPNVTETLLVGGSVGDLGFGLTDGAGVKEDFSLSNSVTDQVVSSTVTATVGQALNLTGSWSPFTSSIDYADRAVDAHLVERLSAITCYEMSADVQTVVRDFYDSWYAEGVPVTYNSSVLLLDLSGSMNEAIDGGSDKLAAAQEAAKQYLHTVQSCGELPQSPPASVTTFGFGETTKRVAKGYDQAACDALDGMSARGETNISSALDEALSVLASEPTCADKHILLLSDGEATRGLSDADMLAGPVAQAAENGIVIDTIGYGNVGESDAGFLKEVASATGGTYYRAKDTYSLKVNFLKSYYSSLGLSLVDEEIAAGAADALALGTADERTSALQVGVVGSEKAPQVTLKCNGVALNDSQYTMRQENGLTSLQCVNPAQGEYSVEIADKSGKAHVFAVKQLGIPRAPAVSGQQTDLSLFLLIGAGGLLLAALAVTIVLTMRKRKSTATSQAVSGFARIDEVGSETKQR